MERFNQPVLKMCRSLQQTRKVTRRHAQVPILVHVYNATFHYSPGLSPYFLRFRRHPRLANEVFLGLNLNSLYSTFQTKYIRRLRTCLRFAYHKDLEVSKNAGSKHKLNYDLRAKSSV